VSGFYNNDYPYQSIMENMQPNNQSIPHCNWCAEVYILEVHTYPKIGATTAKRRIPAYRYFGTN
jgi:hypothetical protein